MKAHQDIEEQLRAAQEAWESAPPAALWDRLEQRLEGGAAPAATPPRSGRWLFRIVGVALVVGVGLGLWKLWPTSQAAAPVAKAFAARSVDFAPVVMDSASPALGEVPANKLSFGENIGIGGAQRGLGSHGFLDGKPGTIGARKSIFSMNGTGRLLLGSSSSPASPSFNSNTAVQDPSSPASPSYNSNIAVQNPSSPASPSYNMNGLPAQGPQPRLFNNRPMIVSNSLGNPIDTVQSLDQFRSAHPADENAYLQLNPRMNDLNFNYRNPNRAEDNRQNLQYLKWLLGSWKSQGNSGGTMEEWRQKDEFTMVGRGYFVVNGDTIVTEEMRIEERGPDLYFIVVKDQSHRSMKFRLRSSQPHELIFESTSGKGTEEMVLRNDPKTDQLQRILQAAPKSSSAQSVPTNPPPKEIRVLRRHERP